MVELVFNTLKNFHSLVDKLNAEVKIDNLDPQYGHEKAIKALRDYFSDVGFLGSYVIEVMIDIIENDDEKELICYIEEEPAFTEVKFNILKNGINRIICEWLNEDISSFHDLESEQLIENNL
jgi:hypothetical protein